MATTNSTEEKALALLGQGYPAETVAQVCGVSASRISQLLSDEEFRDKVAELKFLNLQKHNELDAGYDAMESKLMKNLNQVIPLMLRPMEILKALSTVNAAKRRGSSAPEQVASAGVTVNLIMPNAITQQFTTNANNQVISAGAQTLLTIQSGTLMANIKAKQAESRGDENELRTLNVSTQ